LSHCPNCGHVGALGRSSRESKGENMDLTREKSTLGISRRKLIQAGAWSVPVIAAAVAVPMAAASGGTISYPVRGSGGGGSLSFVNPALEGYQEAWFAVNVDGTGTARTPAMVATFSISGAWDASGAQFEDNNANALVAGGTIIGSMPATLVWTITSVSATEVVLTAAADQEVPVGTTRLQTPQVWALGTADTSTGGVANLKVALTRGVGSDPGNTSSATIV